MQKSSDPLGSGVWEFSLPPSYNPHSTAGRKSVRRPQAFVLTAGVTKPSPLLDPNVGADASRYIIFLRFCLPPPLGCLISSYHHISEPKSASQFWLKSQEKDRNRIFYPSTKSHRELIFWTSGVIFRDEFHGNAQKITAPPNLHFTCFVITFETLQNLQTAGKSRG